MKKKYIMFFLIIIFLIICILFKLITNKTFFKTKYIGVDSQEIFIPKYSYFKEECCMTAASFYSLRSEKELKKEIDNYMKDFEYFDDETTYGYRKDGLFIQKYEVVNKGLYRKIIITY
jgi:uncharacterized membrane protein YqiK